MNSFFEDYLKRESVISCSSSISKGSNDSQVSNLLNESNCLDCEKEKKRFNEESKEKVSCSEQLLFFGPLILCVILLISGIVVFIIVEQRNNKHQNKEIQYKSPFNLTEDENFLPIVCPFDKVTKFRQSEFALNELECGLRRSSVIHIYYSNNPRSRNPGENLTREDILTPPIIELNKEFFSKVKTKSFVLLLIDPKLIPTMLPTVLLHWIRYISLSYEIEEDICSYKLMDHVHIYTQEKLFLLYATNSSQMMIRAKTICNEVVDPFQLTEYLTFIQLKLIASTNFFIPHVPTSEEYNYV